MEQAAMRRAVAEEIAHIMTAFTRQHGISQVWQTPLVRFAAADDPAFAALAEYVTPGHHVPRDYLPEATAVLSYFLPFCPDFVCSNAEGVLISRQWADAYLWTGQLSGQINDALIALCRSWGYAAAEPQDAGMLPDLLRSRWSQRHVARIAGHGTFGRNNMLISDAGCVGRYYSLITTLPVAADAVITEERCPGKNGGSCRLCMARCPVQALTENGFDRRRCLEQCNINEAATGADACGKCLMSLPCSFSVPERKN